MGTGLIRKPQSTPVGGAGGCLPCGQWLIQCTLFVSEETPNHSDTCAALEGFSELVVMPGSLPYSGMSVINPMFMRGQWNTRCAKRGRPNDGCLSRPCIVKEPIRDWERTVFGCLSCRFNKPTGRPLILAGNARSDLCVVDCYCMRFSFGWVVFIPMYLQLIRCFVCR